MLTLAIEAHPRLVDEEFVVVPGPEASIEDLLEFAATYDAYEFVADEPAELDGLLGGVYRAIAERHEVPEWVRLDLARAILFLAYRRDYFSGGSEPTEPMYALAERIRDLSGGRVPRRTRPGRHKLLHADPTGSREVGEFVDSWEYSADRVYRWWYERRWSSGPSLCFVGLNPSTGDTDGKPRPTLAKVVKWAKRQGCGSVVAVNLFAFRSTDPSALVHARVDIVGERNDEEIRQRSHDAQVTLAAWGAHSVARSRAVDVLQLLDSPSCVGVTKSGAPAHPLYVPTSTPLRPYP